MTETVERRYVLRALGVLIAFVALLAVVDVARDATADEPVRIDLVRQCLEDEKLFPVYELPVTSFLAKAQGGGLRAIVETTNQADVAIAGSGQEARLLVREALRESSDRRLVEERRGFIVLWRDLPTETQRRALIDCTY